MTGSGNCRLFGTDGVRGRANVYPVDPHGAVDLAQALARTVDHPRGGHAPRVIIGKDTRLSGYMMELAMASGFVAAGMEVLLVGPLPTPAIPLLVSSMRADLGLMITASHNHYTDNGIKIFAAGGDKIDRRRMEVVEETVRCRDFSPAAAGKIGQVFRINDVQGRYVEHVKRSFPGDLDLEGMRLVVDCAHGAAWRIAPMVFEELGAWVHALGVAPNGHNINDSGVMAMDGLVAAVREHGADGGLALDGDGDRLLMVDAHGAVMTGDHLLGVIAGHGAAEVAGAETTVVGTILSNSGLEHYLGGLGLGFCRTDVGDHHISALLRKHDWRLGGEPSGHVILGPDSLYTADGLMAALRVLAIARRKACTLADLHSSIPMLPQLSTSVPVSDRDVCDTPSVRDQLEELRAELSDASDGEGRLIVRPSGTEQVIRVTVEAPHIELCQLFGRKVHELVSRVVRGG